MGLNFEKILTRCNNKSNIYYTLTTFKNYKMSSKPIIILGNYTINPRIK